MHRAMCPVVPGIFQNEEDCNLIGHLVDRGEGYSSIKAKILGYGVEQPEIMLNMIGLNLTHLHIPNLGQLDGEMTE